MEPTAIPVLDASRIKAGILVPTAIPALDASRIQAGVFVNLAEAMSEFQATVYELAGSMLELLESMPTRSKAIYAVLNKPWELDNWRYLPHAPTRRAVRRLRADHEDVGHIRWSAALMDEMRSRP